MMYEKFVSSVFSKSWYFRLFTDYVTWFLEEVLRLREEVSSIKLAIQKAKVTQQVTPAAACTSYSNYKQTLSS